MNDITAMSGQGFHLSRNAFGRLMFAPADGGTPEEVIPVRAFPIESETEKIALVGQGGHELAWIETLNDLPEASRRLLQEELNSREFMPEIQRIVAVSGYATPCVWTLETNRGNTQLVLRSEQDIRRISMSKLLISDSHGVHFLVRSIESLDRASRRFLDRFL